MNTQSKHTPGEWLTSRDAVPDGHVQLTVYSVETGNRVATVFDREENAYVIAALPELLAALVVLVDHAQETHPHFESERGQRDIKAALDAIHKALNP